MADVKNLLKDARKYIDERNYKDAQECCKNILRKDKQNYFALVLLGKSLRDSDQAPLAYRKAIATKPDHPLAWQGLANYYESNDNDSKSSRLLPIYTELLKLHIEDDKALEVLNKFGQLGSSLKHSECISTLLQYIANSHVEKLRETATKQLIDLLKANVKCKEEDLSDIIKILTSILEKERNESLEVLSAKVLIQKETFVETVNEIMNLKFFDSNLLLREWFCKYLCEKYIENLSFYEFQINLHLDRITCRIENLKYPALLKCICLYDCENYIECYKQIVPLINYQQADVTEATMIIKCTLKLKKWSVTEKLALNFLSRVKNEKFAYKLKIFLFFSLAKQKNWKKALLIGKEFPLEHLKEEEQALLAECFIENNIDATHLFEHLKNSNYFTRLQALNLLKQEKFEDTISLLELAQDSMVKYFYLGVAYWESKEHDKSLVNLLKAAKLDPENSDIFYYLGNYYYEKADYSKAKKCLEKSLDLNKIDSKIVKKLSDIYATLRLNDKDFDLLLSTEKTLKNNETWIEFRLGLHYLAKRNSEQAIIHFRNVIKANHDDVNAFECLADAYYSRGSYTSALRAYNKVITMDYNKSCHCLTRIGYIHSLLTQYEDAIATFKRVLAIDPFSILALKGLAETWIRIAYKKEDTKLYGSARDCAQNAVDYITKGLVKGKHLICFWKLLGDTLMFIKNLPDKFSYVCFQKDKESVRMEKVDVVSKAISCYAHIAKQRQQLASYDLALAYLSYYHETKNFLNCHIAYKLAINCVKEKPTSWRCWNLLGKICMFKNKYDLAQHCFIKALLVTRKWSVAKVWCNLGTLYVKVKLYKLANYCFWRGQSTLPSYAQSWIGQGMIAEVLREEEAMDLFRHACRLGYHPESALGYADWVCRTLKQRNYNEDPEFKYVIESLNAVTYAIDLLEWFSNFEPNNSCALNILGILQERSGLLRPALKSFEQALQWARDDKKNVILLNIGRVLLRIEKYDEAIKAYKAITEASFDSTCGLALALFKKGLYEESYSVYDTALHWLSNDDNEKAELLVAMAGIIYMYKGADDAKTILFHSIQVSQNKPNAYSLFGICSLGIIHSEPSLTKLALSELKKYKMNSDFGYDIGFLKSFLSINEGNIIEALKLVSDSIHNYPNNALLWYCVAEYCLRNNTRTKLASHSAQKAICLGKKFPEIYNSAKMIATASIAEHISDDKVKAFNLAKQGLHLYPDSTEIWSALLLSLLSHKIWVEKKNWISSVVSYLRRHMSLSKTMTRWISLLEKKLSR